MIDLVGTHIKELRRKTKVTVLRRPGGTWSNQEIALLVSGSRNAVCRHPEHPEYLLMPSERSKDWVVGIIFADNFDHDVVQGMDSPLLPFIPQFI